MRPPARLLVGIPAMGALLLLLALSLAGVQEWLFLPCGPEPHPEVAATPAASIAPGQAPSTFKSAIPPAGQEPPAPPTWHRAAFPHMDHDRLNPDPKGAKGGSHAWYATLLTPPAWAAGMDLALDLGMIDDADEVHVNGVRVAGTGNMRNSTGSAWNRPRRYRVPGERLAGRDPGTAGEAAAEPDRILVNVKQSIARLRG